MFKGNSKSIETLGSDIIKGKMRERRLSSRDMCCLLKENFSIELTEKSFNNKISRGRYTSLFFFQCISVMEITILELNLKGKSKWKEKV